MSALIALLRGKTLGETVYRLVLAGLLLVAIGWTAWAFVSGRWWAWRADVWKERAQAAADAARQERANARSADAGAANATATRQGMDTATGAVRAETEAAAERIERHAHPDNPAAVDDAGAELVRELDDAEARARAAADRLQRTRSR